MHISDLDLLGASICILSFLDLARSQEVCVCRCEFASDSPDSTLIREILNHQSSQRIPEIYFPWWLFWLVLIIGVCIGLVLELLVRKLFALLCRLGEGDQTGATVAPAAIPVTPCTLSLRDGRAR